MAMTTNNQPATEKKLGRDQILGFADPGGGSPAGLLRRPIA